MPKSTTIWWLLFGLMMAALPAYYHLFYDISGPAFEDAAMLMRYADHLAQGYGIVYNPGEAPIDGATDFLFLLMVSAIHSIGLPVEASVRVLVLIAHLLTIALVFHTSMRQGAPGWAALLSALWIATGPAMLQAQAGFGAPVFALSAAVTWSLCMNLQNEGESFRTAIAFAVAALITSLIRPEGVFLTGFMLVSLWLSSGLRAIRRTVVSYLLVMGVIGGGYFLWRWSYFGHPLPNPFYIKGYGMLYPSSLKNAMRNTVVLGWPFILLALPALFGGRHRMERRTILFHLIPISAFIAIWLLLSNAMNYAHRFQYALLPIILMSWFPLTQVAPRSMRPVMNGNSTGAVLTCLLIFAGLGLQHRQYAMKGQPFVDGRVALARDLAPFADKGYRMAITEAGNLPLYSKWKALDTWGLNDARIAHEGIVTQAYLKEMAPEIVMYHTHYAENPPHAPVDAPWEKMVDTLKAFVKSASYLPAAEFGTSEFNLHAYYVRSDCPDATQLVQLIRNRKYVWYENGDTLAPLQ